MIIPVTQHRQQLVDGLVGRNIVGRLDEFFQGTIRQFLVHQVPGCQCHDTHDVADIPAIYREPVIATPAHQGNGAAGIPVTVDRRQLGNRYHGLANRGLRKANDTFDAHAVKNIYIGPAIGHVHNHAHLFPGNKDILLGLAATHEACAQASNAGKHKHQGIEQYGKHLQRINDQRCELVGFLLIHALGHDLAQHQEQRGKQQHGIQVAQLTKGADHQHRPECRQNDGRYIGPYQGCSQQHIRCLEQFQHQLCPPIPLVRLVAQLELVRVNKGDLRTREKTLQQQEQHHHQQHNQIFHQRFSSGQ